MTHNRRLTFLFLEDNDPIAAKPAAQTLSLNLLVAHLHFLRILFSNQKTYKPYLLMLFDIHYIYNFL